MGFFFDKDIEKTAINSKSSYKVIAHDDAIMACRFYYESGGIGTLSSHANDQICIILSGRFEFTLSGDTAVITAGDSVYIPRGEEHSLVCLEKGELINIFAPAREDLV